LAQGQAVAPLERLPLASRVANALVAYVAYLGKFFWPVDLAPFYPHSAAGFPIWKVAATVLALVVITAAVMARRWRNPYLLVGWLWYLGMLVPVIGLVQVGGQSIADRYTYLPQVGLAIVLAWAAAEAYRRWPASRWLWSVVATLTLAALMTVAWRQTGYWRDSVPLWYHTLACTSRNTGAHINLGAALSDRGRTAEAIIHFQQALKLKPEYAETHNNLANMLLISGRIEEAIPHYQRALEITPDYAEVHANLGTALAKLGRTDEAIKHYQKALVLAKQQHKTAMVKDLMARLRSCQKGTARPAPQLSSAVA
jgi:tetratricopeptide (TPR) repeat protein